MGIYMYLVMSLSEIQPQQRTLATIFTQNFNVTLKIEIEANAAMLTEAANFKV